MFGIGSTELLVILLVALIVLGPKSLAGFSRTLGKFIGEFRRVSTDFQRTLNLEAAEEEAREKEAKKRNGVEKTAATEQPQEKNDEIVRNPFMKNGDSAKRADEELPPDSPLAQAVRKARAEAEAAEQEAAAAVNLAKEEMKSEPKTESKSSGA